MIYSLNTKQPCFSTSNFIADNATLIGDVTLEENSSIWFNAIIRADNAPIIIGACSNIQDGAVLHTDPNFTLKIADHVTIGHKAMLHGCTVGSCSLIGINAVILNGATIGRHCIIGANALITENKVIPDGSVVIGSPAYIKRSLKNDEKIALKKNAVHYVQRSKYYREHLSLNRAISNS